MNMIHEDEFTTVLEYIDTECNNGVCALLLVYLWDLM